MKQASWFLALLALVGASLVIFGKLEWLVASGVGLWAIALVGEVSVLAQARHRIRASTRG